MAKKIEVDLDKVVEFYDPHPGFAGAAIRIPEPVRKAADEISGKRMPLREALELLRKATDEELEVIEKYNYIMLKIKGWGDWRGALHTFNVIRFR